MNKVYGYCRISTNKQNIDRQVRNILATDSKAIIIKEVFTGTKFQGRKEFDKLVKHLHSGDTVIFDSVSRMSRNSEEGWTTYETLYNQGINLVFLNEPHINTATYRKAISAAIPMTGTNVDFILEGINRYLMELAKEQVQLAFDQSEKEVADLHTRTKGGIETARRNGKQIGRAKGSHITTKKSITAKQIIKAHNKSFGGSLDDTETMKLADVSRVTFYKYKKEISTELSKELA